MVKSSKSKSKPKKLSDDEVMDIYRQYAKEILGNIDYKFVLSASVYTFLWWRAYGAGKLPTKEDVLLGIVYALTVPEGLKGGILANTYALSVLAALGVGFIPPDALEWMQEQAYNIVGGEDSPAGQVARVIADSRDGFFPPIVRPPHTKPGQ